MIERKVSSIPELLDVIRDRRDELNLAHTTIDGIAGYADGYTSKLLSPAPMKGLGAMSLAALLGALALGIAEVTITEDPEQAEQMVSRWLRRRRRPNDRCVVKSMLRSDPSDNEGDTDVENRRTGQYPA